MVGRAFAPARYTMDCEGCKAALTTTLEGSRMSSHAKIGAAIGTALLVIIIAVWIGAAPKTNASRIYPSNSLGAATESMCALDRSGTFTDADLKDALTCRDLAAQESMATSTAQLVWLSWMQILVAALGAGVVFWTVVIGIEALRVSQREVENQQAFTREQLRPRFTPARNPFVIEEDGSSSIHLEFTNIGASTARKLRKIMIYKVVPNLKDNQCQLSVEDFTLNDKSTVLAMSGKTGWRIALNKSDTNRIRSGTHVLQIAAGYIFDDNFGGKYRYVYSAVYFGPNLERVRSLPNFKVAHLEPWHGREV